VFGDLRRLVSAADRAKKRPGIAPGQMLGFLLLEDEMPSWSHSRYIADAKLQRHPEPDTRDQVPLLNHWKT